MTHNQFVFDRGTCQVYWSRSTHKFTWYTCRKDFSGVYYLLNNICDLIRKLVSVDSDYMIERPTWLLLLWFRMWITIVSDDSLVKLNQNAMQFLTLSMSRCWIQSIKKIFCFSPILDCSMNMNEKIERFLNSLFEYVMNKKQNFVVQDICR